MCSIIEYRSYTCGSELMVQGARSMVSGKVTVSMSFRGRQDVVSSDAIRSTCMARYCGPDLILVKLLVWSS